MHFLIEKPQSNSYNVPVLIICYNRAQYIEEQINQLKKVKPTKVFIACDGPKKNQDIQKVVNVRARYLELIDWDCDIQTRFSEENQGCFQGVKNALTWFFGINKEGIILEDDIIPSDDFFYFSKAMLDHFRNDKTVFNISGCTIGYEAETPIVVSKIMNMWGWATWADRFFDVDFNIASWADIKNKKQFLQKKLRLHPFDYDAIWVDFWEDIFDRAVNNGDFSTWDYQLIYNQLESNKVTIYPNRNLVQNLGFGDDATHTTDENHAAIKLNTRTLDWPLHMPKKLLLDKVFYEKFIKERWAYHKRPNWKYHLGAFLKKMKS